MNREQAEREGWWRLAGALLGFHLLLLVLAGIAEDRKAANC
jgi:hypothetical protein